ncbi:hypothetical protein, partial [Pseudomonas fluorescens]|uniref:hypothetical protein n=1 Tax=Pseudomonas fluorescens TaxID=294 RepID=UPI001E5ACF09
MAVDFAFGFERIGKLKCALPDRTPSRASSLPQWGEVNQTMIGRLSGRHREQAHSYRKAKANRIRFSPLNRM